MKVSLITGASSGIGRAFANRLADEKHNLFLVARSEDRLSALAKDLAQQHDIRVEFLAADLSTSAGIETVLEKLAAKDLEVDWLINNAGCGTGGDLLEYDLQDYENMMRLNMNCMVSLTYHLLPRMRIVHSGTIINVGSMAGFNPVPYMNVYAASKGFVKYFTQALWEENRLYGIKVMLLCPGATDTGFFEAAKISPDNKPTFSTKKLNTPEEVVDAAMKGLRQNNVITISGLQNKIGRRLLSLVPEGLGLKFFGDTMRKNLHIEIR